MEQSKKKKNLQGYATFGMPNVAFLPCSTKCCWIIYSMWPRASYRITYELRMIFALFSSNVCHVQLLICTPPLLLFPFSFTSPILTLSYSLFCNAIHASWAIKSELSGYVSSIYCVTIPISNIIIIVIVIIIIMEMLEIVLKLLFCSASLKRAAGAIIWSVCGFFICFPFKLFTQLNRQIWDRKQRA